MVNDIINGVRKLVDDNVALFDPSVELIKRFEIPNYHSNLKPGEYHRINRSINLAAAIFSCEYEKHYDIAKKLLRKAISLQCKTGETSGLWSYFYEESLEEMIQPDWNYADFNAFPMLYILKEHSDKLDKELYAYIVDACSLACGAIVRRNLTIGYTNPTVMGIYCTVVCGKLLDIDEFTEYGRKKLDKFYLHTMDKGTYDEHNCPGYNVLIANIYSLMLRHIEDIEIIKKVNDLNRLVWTMLGEHFHYRLMDFTGPNFRRYNNFLSEATSTIFEEYLVIMQALDLKEFIDNVSLLSMVYQTKCPEDIKFLFFDENKVVDSRRVLSPESRPTVDTQHIRPHYTLGSFNMCDCWNQRRNVVAYIGDRHKKVCIRLRAYHDNYDFASGFTTTAQQESTAISLTNFHTDGGDTHCNLDILKDATFKATDLRVVYQIEANCDGIIEEIIAHKTENGFNLEIMGTSVEIGFPFMEMTGCNPYVEITTTDKEMLVSAVLYSGEEKDINLNSLDSLAVVSVLSVGEYSTELPQITKDSELLIADLKANGASLTVKGAYKPLKSDVSMLLNDVLVDGDYIWNKADLPL